MRYGTPLITRKMSSKIIKKRYKPSDIRAWSPRKVLGFTGEWEALAGNPEISGSWIIWGRSFSGKTSFAVRLAKYIASLGGKVAYLSLEEGLSLSLKRAFERENMESVNNKVELWQCVGLEEIEKLLARQRSADVVIIDSVQYLGINYAGYKKLRQAFPKKLFIFISHANEQKEPAGATAVKIRYDASVKILVDGFVATAFSRYGGGRAMTIWEEGAKLNVTKKGEYDEREDEAGEEYCEEI